MYAIDETYAGPWAHSPLASPRATVRDAVTPVDRAPTFTPPGGNRTSADGARAADSMLGRLGPLGMLASIVMPAAMGPSSGLAGKPGVSRVTFAKMAGGYGVVVAGRF